MLERATLMPIPIKPVVWANWLARIKTPLIFSSPISSVIQASWAPLMHVTPMPRMTSPTISKEKRGKAAGKNVSAIQGIKPINRLAPPTRKMPMITDKRRLTRSAISPVGISQSNTVI